MHTSANTHARLSQTIHTLQLARVGHYSFFLICFLNSYINQKEKKFIKLKLEKDGKNFIEYNDSRNDKTEQMEKRKQILNKAKDLAESPYNLNVNINNSN